MYETVIRGGTLVDGSGAPGRSADLAIEDGRIVEIGARLSGATGPGTTELDASGFLWPEDKRPSMVQNIRAMFQRASLSEQEVRTLHGMIKALAHSRERRPRRT